MILSLTVAGLLVGLSEVMYATPTAPTAKEIVWHLQRADEDQARRALTDYPTQPGAETFALVCGLEPYLEFFTQFPAFKAAPKDVEFLRRRFEAREWIQDLLQSDCNELKQRWTNFWSKPHDQTNLVAVFHHYKETTLDWSAYIRLGNNPAAAVLRNLQNGNQAEAQKGLEEWQWKIRPDFFATFVGIKPHLRFFDRFAPFQQTQDGWAKLCGAIDARELLQSECCELKQRWLDLKNRPHDQVNLIEFLYHAKTIFDEWRAWQAIKAAQDLYALERSQSPTHTSAEPDLSPFDLAAFERKLAAVRQDPAMQRQASWTQITIDRRNFMLSACTQILRLSKEELNGVITVAFDGEPGIDAGGLMRELFTLLSKELFNMKTGLFYFSASGNYRVGIHPRSRVVPERWVAYSLVGRLLGLALFHNKLLGVQFSSGFCKALLGCPFNVEDLRDVDRTTYETAAALRASSSAGYAGPPVADLGLFFSVDEVVDGANRQVALIPQRANEEVNDENKHEYLNALTDYHLKCYEQMGLVRKGLLEVVPKEVLELFNWAEIRYLFAGADKISVADWRRNTVYEGCDGRDQLVLWFWDIVEKALSEEQRAGLLQFITGSPFVPVTGFKDLEHKFTIVHKPEGRAIAAHTCSYSIDIPRFDDRALFEAAVKVCTEGQTGFQLA